MRKKNSNKKKKMPVGLKRFLTAVLAVFFTFFITCVIIGAYMLNDLISTVNGERLIDLEFYKQNQDQTTIIYANDAENNPVELIRLHGEQNRVWVSKDEMSPWLGKAFVAIEDKRFYEHHGVDWKRTASVVATKFFKQGGSTITQQLIKNLTGENGRTFNRKYHEIVNALNFEKYYPDKEVILEAYLNTVYLSHGCYGVKTAAEMYFGKNVSELNIAECAAIAGITQSPGEFDPLWHPKANKTRQELVLWNMLDQGMITQAEYDEAVKYELIFTNSDKYVAKEVEDEGDTALNNEIQSYYVDYVISCVIRDLKAAGYSAYEANKMIYSGGLRIYSAIDTSIQDILEDIYVHRTGFPSERLGENEKAAQSAMTIMDYSGRVVAIIGGAGEKTQNRTNNRAISAVRQPGSSIKPLSIYAPAIEENYATWSSLVQNYGIYWQGSIWPTNYGGDHGSPNSYVTAQDALRRSLNTVPAQLLMMMGFETSYSYLTEKFHVSTLTQSDAHYPSALATGGTTGGVTTLQMAAAFASFGNGGKYYKPYSYYKVTDSTGENIILQNSSEGEQILSPESAYVMNEMMRTVMTSGTGKGNAVNGFTTFGKTGTSGTSYESSDRWCVAGTPYYVAAVWYGYDYQKEINTNGNPAGQIFKQVMDRIHKNLAPKSFDKFTDNVVQRAYCTETGLLAGDGCASKAMGWYKTSNLPGVCTRCSGVKPPDPESTTGATDTPPTEPPTENPTEPPTPPTEPPASQPGPEETP